MRHYRALLGIGLCVVIAGTLLTPSALPAQSQTIVMENTATTAVGLKVVHTAPRLAATLPPSHAPRHQTSLASGIHANATITPTWSLQSSNTTAGLRGIACAGASLCYVTGTTGTVLVSSTVTGGWTPQTSGTTDELAGVSCPDAATCYAVGGSSLSGGSTGTIVATNTTTANTASWMTQASIPNTFLTGVTCPSSHRLLRRWSR